MSCCCKSYLSSNKGKKGGSEFLCPARTLNAQRSIQSLKTQIAPEECQHDDWKTVVFLELLTTST